MSFFRRPDYRSDTTNFINDLKKQKPELANQQLAGRALLWDKDVNAEVWEDLRAGRCGFDLLDGDGARGAGLVLDHHGLAQRFGHVRRHQAGHGVQAHASRKAQHQADHVLLRLRSATQARQGQRPHAAKQPRSCAQTHSRL